MTSFRKFSNKGQKEWEKKCLLIITANTLTFLRIHHVHVSIMHDLCPVPMPIQHVSKLIHAKKLEVLAKAN